ncbi:hypothetical protein ACNKHK_03830 [Shigella flexneri]
MIALRELALRRTADRVDDRMPFSVDVRERRNLAYRDAILLCIGHNTGSEKLVRAAASGSAPLGGVWHAVYCGNASAAPTARKTTPRNFKRPAINQRSWVQEPPPFQSR